MPVKLAGAHHDCDTEGNDCDSGETLRWRSDEPGQPIWTGCALFQASLAGESLRSGSGYSRPLRRIVHNPPVFYGTPVAVPLRCFVLDEECIKWSSPFAETLSKKEIQRPIQRPLGAV